MHHDKDKSILGSHETQVVRENHFEKLKIYVQYNWYSKHYKKSHGTTHPAHLLPNVKIRNATAVPCQTRRYKNT